MRIISGKYRGYRIKVLKKFLVSTKIMTDRIKEDLFNILDNYFIYENKIGLDIFSGSGQLGIEGLSRGLKQCYLNDFNKSASEAIKKNISNLKIKNAIILNYDFSFVINKFFNEKIMIDILFLDPPFKLIRYYYDVIFYVLKFNILNDFGIIVCESNQKLLFDKYELNLLKVKKYKNKYLYILRKEKGKTY